jgi:hypothetical protein
MVSFFSFFRGNRAGLRDAAMPSLIRLLAVLGMLAGLTYGAMYALAYWYDPKPREITVSVPADRFAKQH